MNTTLSSIKSLTFTLLLLLIAQVIVAQQIKVSPQRASIKAGENIEISYSVENMGNGQFIPPKLDNFAVVSGPNQYQSMQWINGKSSSILRYSYTLRPTKTGKLTLKGAGFKTRKKTINAPSIYITVSGKIPQSPNQAIMPKNGNTNDPRLKADTNVVQMPDLFYRIEVDTNRVYLGQQATVAYSLYTVNYITNYSSVTTPNLQGFWVQDISPSRITPTTLTIGNKVYQKYVIKKYALFPQRTGELEIDPMELEVSVRQIARNSRRSFFRHYNTINKKLKCEGRKLAVYPLPDKGKPNNFNGTIGNFKINVRPDRTSCKVNEGITLNVGIIGNGNLKLIESLNLDLPDNFEVYDPTVSENIYEQNNVVMGTKSFEYLLVPKEEGEYTIPSIPFTYYNPATERYETKKSKPLKLTIYPSNETVSTPKKEKAIEDIMGIKTDSTSLHSTSRSKLPLVLFGLLYLAPFLALPLLISRKRKEDLVKSDVVGLKRKQALSVAQKKLTTAEALMSQNKKKDFYNEIIHTIWGYLEDRVNIPASELSKDNISKVLMAKNVKEAKCNKLIETIQYCEMAIFAPVKDADNLQQTYQDTMQVIADIEEDLTS